MPEPQDQTAAPPAPIPPPLSPQDIQDLQDISTRLPAGHPTQKKISMLLNSQPTQFEKQREGAFQSNATIAFDPEDPLNPGTQVGQLAGEVLTHPRQILSGAWNTAKGLVGGLANMPTNPVEMGVSGAKLGMQIANEDAARREAGRSPAYRALAAGGTALGIPALQMEESADVGRPAEIAGAAGTSIGAAVAPSAIKAARGALLKSRAASAPTRGANLYERTVSPGGMKAEGQLESRETFNRAAPYLAEQERQTPVFNKQPEGQFAGQEMGVMNYRQNAQAAGQRLWGQIEPRAQMYERAPFEANVPDAVRGTINPTEAQLNPGKVAGVNSLADFYGNVKTVGEALDRITELNNDKGVQAYEKALPDKQAELLKGDPTIEGKITAANTLREGVFSSIEKYGNPADAQWIRGARQDWGALSEVGKNLGNTQVPTPQPLTTRLANSLRMTLSPTFAREYLSKPVATLFDLNNPNRLALKSSQALGSSGLQPTEPPPVRLTPWDPSVRPSGPVVGPGQSGQPALFTGGGPRPMITPPQEPVPSGPGGNVAAFPEETPMWSPSVSNAPVNWNAPGGTGGGIDLWNAGNTLDPLRLGSGGTGAVASSTIPPETPYGPPSTQGPPPLPPGVTEQQWNRMPAALRNRFGFQAPTPGTYSAGAAADVTPQGAPLPSSTPPITVQPPTMPPTPQGAVTTPGTIEPYDEMLRRGAPGVSPEKRSLRRQFEKRNKTERE